MKKMLCMALSLVLVFALCACGGKQEPKTAEKLIVGFDAEFPPFGFIDENGAYDGFDLAMAQEVCKRLGWEYEAVAIDWNSKDAELSSGNINCIWNGFTYTGREDQYTWSEPYVDNSIVLVVKSDSGIASKADLAGKTVMAQAASSAVDALEADESGFAASLKEVIQLADYNMGFMELNQGTVDAVAADLGVAAYQIANNAGSYVILDEPISTEQYAVGFLKGNTALRDKVNEQLLAMAADGTMLEIAKKYVDTGLVLESLCLIAQDGAPAPAAEPTAAELPGELIVGFDPEYPPFGFLAADGSFDGFDLALAQEACDRLGWTFTAVPIDWTSKDAELSSGNINCIWNGFSTAGREDQYTWSDPYVDNQVVIVVRADSGIETLADLAGKTIMGQSGSSSLQAVYNNETLSASAQVVELPDYNSGYMELRAGTIDAVASGLGVAIYQMDSNEGNYKMLDESIFTEQYAVGFRKGDTALCEAINEQLAAMAADGTMLKIAENYVEEGLDLDSLCMIR